MAEEQSIRLYGILLTQGQTALVDQEDFEALNQFKWCALWNPCTQSFVAARNLPRDSNGKQRTIYMHREVMHAPKGVIVDHRNHNTLDNRKQNLRLATSVQNGWNKQKLSHNTSGYKGVSWDKATSRWLVQIRQDGRTKKIGRFDNLEAAAEAYRVAARAMHGEFLCESVEREIPSGQVIYTEPRKATALIERFMKYVVVQENGCWQWTGCIDNDGYGRLWTVRNTLAHRVSYELQVGPIPEGFQLDHLCRVRSCVNPAHLQPVTGLENNHRGLSGENNRSKTHCPRGHEYTAENIWANRGRRHCRACRRIKGKARPPRPYRPRVSK